MIDINKVSTLEFKDFISNFVTYAYFGSAFDPLTKVHEEIINLSKSFLKNKLQIGIITDLKYKNTIESLQNRLNILKNSNIECNLIQDCRTYNFLNTHNFSKEININTIIIGSDEYENLSTWEHYKELIDEFNFIVYTSKYLLVYKKGDINNPIYKIELINELGKSRSSKARMLLNYHQIKDSPSSMVELLNNISIKTKDFIIDHSLYHQRGFNVIQAENKYLKSYEPDKFPHFIGVTVDTILFGKDYKEIILIRRGGEINKYLWAFPGGFVDVNKDITIKDAAKRELKEETNLDIELTQYKSFILNFDPRGKILTNVFYHVFNYNDIELKNKLNELKIKAGDDASELTILQTKNILDYKDSIPKDHMYILTEFLKDKQV